MHSLRELHVSFLTEPWTAYTDLQKQSAYHKRPGEFALASFGKLDLCQTAREFFTDIPTLESVSFKVFDRATANFRREVIL